MHVLLTTLLLASPPGTPLLVAQATPADDAPAVAAPAAAPSSVVKPMPPPAPKDPPTASPLHRPEEATASKPALLGAQLGAGAPEGFTLSAVVRPVKWVRASAGFAHNILGPGIQGSVTAVPFHWGVVPTFTLEAGKFFQTDVSGRFSGSFPKALDPALQKFGYTYYSAQLGAEFGSQERFVFFLRGGLAWVRSGLGDVQGYQQGGTTVDVTNPRLSATVPTVNLGFLLYVW